MNSSTNGKHYLAAINVLFQAASSLARKHSLKLCLYTEVSRHHPEVSGAACQVFKTLMLAGEDSAASILWRKWEESMKLFWASI